MKFVLFSFLLLILTFWSCSTCKETDSNYSVIKGISTVVGNEPFTRIAIITDQQKTYLIDSDKNILNTLLKNQGHIFEVKYKSLRDSAGTQIIQTIEANEL